ncbi:MAG: hypothetical protein SPI30_02690 [Prevotella sp.]|nr:hypothetical protein [Prevotella sp.]
MSSRFSAGFAEDVARNTEEKPRRSNDGLGLIRKETKKTVPRNAEDRHLCNQQIR